MRTLSRFFNTSLKTALKTGTLTAFIGIGVGLAGCGDGTLPAAGNNTGGGTPDMAEAAPLATDRSIALPSFTLAPGEEKTLCAYVPADGMERYVNRFLVDMSPGSHHLVVYRMADNGSPARGPEECNTGVPSGMLPGAQEIHTDLGLPEGIAMKLGAKEALYFQMHYINATGKDTITAKVTYQMKTIEKAKVQQLAGEMFYGIWSLNIPTGQSVSAESCKSPKDMNLILATGHMHMHATSFDSSVADTTLYHTNNWDQPLWSSFGKTGMPVKQGDAISWKCSYDNQTGAPLHFGDSALKNEMCILVGLYYPSANSETLFFCQK